MRISWNWVFTHLLPCLTHDITTTIAGAEAAGTSAGAEAAGARRKSWPTQASRWGMAWRLLPWPWGGLHRPHHRGEGKRDTECRGVETVANIVVCWVSESVHLWWLEWTQEHKEHREDAWFILVRVIRALRPTTNDPCIQEHPKSGSYNKVHVGISERNH